MANNITIKDATPANVVVKTTDTAGVHTPHQNIDAIAAGDNNIGNVDVLTIAAGDNNIGNVDVVTLPALPAGTNNIGDVDVLTLPGVVGTVADDATTPGAPVMIGGSAKSPDGTTPGSVSAEDDVARLTTDLNRRLYVNPRHAFTWSYHSDGSAALTDASVQAAPGAGLQIVITEIIFSTGAATACNIFFEEGTTKILGPWYLEAVAGRGVVWRGEKKVTANTALTVTTSAAIAQSVDVQGYIQAV